MLGVVERLRLLQDVRGSRLGHDGNAILVGGDNIARVDGDTTPRLKTGNGSRRLCGVSRTDASITAPATPRYFIAVAIRPPMPAKSAPSSSTIT